MPDTRTQIGSMLVANDDQGCREYVAELLINRGYKVVCATDGAQAAELFHSQHVDLALLDVRMPQRTGFEVCKELKSEAATRLTPIVPVTGLMGAQDRIQGLECGANDSISKPVHREELLAREALCCG